MTLKAEDLARIALQAGVLIMEIYESDFEIERKDDKSPVTEADRIAEAFILKELAKIEPDLPVVAEESVSDGKDPVHGPRFALVDPVDGTKQFISKNGEFTVNIGLIEHGKPVMGVVFAPAKKRLFVAESPFEGWQAEAASGAPVPGPEARRALSIRKAPECGLTAIASTSHRSGETDAFLTAREVANIISSGSSLKFCLVAAGEADVYPRHGRTMQWDTAAGHAIAQAAGAKVTRVDGGALTYGKHEGGYENPHFIVWGDCV